MANAWNKNENWECLRTFLPCGWETAARVHGAWQRKARNFPSVEILLRVMLIHLADGCSLRETAVRSREGGLAEVSNVALLRRLKASSEWFRWMTLRLLERRNTFRPPPQWLAEYKVRTVDASVICEPGSTGTDWRLHYCLDLFTLSCDEFYLTDPKGGETFCRFKIHPGDLMMGDRAYGRIRGFWHVVNNGGHFVSRLKNKAFVLMDGDGKEHQLSSLLSSLRVGDIGDWSLNACVDGQAALPLRICALRMSEEAAEKAIRKKTKEMKKKQRTLDPETLALHRYVVVATSLPSTITAAQIMLLYRSRWQIELAFKRLKSIMGLGHLPKFDEESSKAWLQGKLLVALLAQAIVNEGRAFSPWGYPIHEVSPEEKRVA